MSQYQVSCKVAMHCLSSAPWLGCHPPSMEPSHGTLPWNPPMYEIECLCYYCETPFFFFQASLTEMSGLGMSNPAATRSKPVHAINERGAGSSWTMALPVSRKRTARGAFRTQAQPRKLACPPKHILAPVTLPVPKKQVRIFQIVAIGTNLAEGGSLKMEGQHCFKKHHNLLFKHQPC